MVLSFGITVAIVSGVWGFVGIILPILVQCFMWKSPNKGTYRPITSWVGKGKQPNQTYVVQTSLVLTAACCYLFWISTYLCQLNPQIGPQLETHLIRIMQLEWPKE